MSRKKKDTPVAEQESKIEFKGTLTLKEHVLVTDPIYSVTEWCQTHVENMDPGVYECYEQTIGDKVARIYVIKAGSASLEELEFDEAPMYLGMDGYTLGIFNYDYIKGNKTTHDKSWREELKAVTCLQVKNPNYVPIQETKAYKKFVKNVDRVKNELRAKSQYRPDLLAVLDDLFNCDPNVSVKEMTAAYAILPGKFLERVGLFIENKARAIREYNNSDESKEYLDVPATVIYDNECFITYPDIDNAPFICYLGSEVDSDTVCSIIIDFDVLEDPDDEAENEEFDMEMVDWDKDDIDENSYVDFDEENDAVNEGSESFESELDTYLTSIQNEDHDDYDEFLDDVDSFPDEEDDGEEEKKKDEEFENHDEEISSEDIIDDDLNDFLSSLTEED